MTSSDSDGGFDLCRTEYGHGLMSAIGASRLFATFITVINILPGTLYWSTGVLIRHSGISCRHRQPNDD